MAHKERESVKGGENLDLYYIANKKIYEDSLYTCPHCKSTSFRKHGKDRGVQRYRCKNCKRTFRAATGTSVHYLHKKDLIDKYLEALRAGLSIRAAAIAVGISKNTSFAWRHKLLTSLTKSVKITEEKKENAKGAKIIKLPYSDKGRQKEPEKYTSQSVSLLIVDKNQVHITRLSPGAHVKNGARILNSLEKQTFIANHSDRTLNTIVNKSTKTPLPKNTSAYKELKSKLEFTTMQLLEWMERFQGVATKYLHHYWHWFSITENVRLNKLSQEEFKEFCVLLQSRADFFLTHDL